MFKVLNKLYLLRSVIMDQQFRTEIWVTKSPVVELVKALSCQIVQTLLRTTTVPAVPHVRGFFRGFHEHKSHGFLTNKQSGSFAMSVTLMNFGPDAFCNTHMAHLSHTPAISHGVDFNILVKLHTPATPKNDHYFLKPKAPYRKPSFLTSESVWLTRRNSWSQSGPLNNLWTRVRGEKMVTGVFPGFNRFSLKDRNWQRSVYTINTVTVF